jgi:hypothetical protein
MIVNKIKDGSVAELTTAHKLNSDCPCGVIASIISKKNGSGYSKYNYTMVYTHKSVKNFTEKFFDEFAKRFPVEV